MNNKPKDLFVLFEGINSTFFNPQVIEHISKFDKFDFQFKQIYSLLRKLKIEYLSRKIF